MRNTKNLILFFLQYIPLLETIDTILFSQAAKFHLDTKKKLFKKLKHLETVNGRIAMGGLVYLLFTKLFSSHTDIIDQLKSILI